MSRTYQIHKTTEYINNLLPYNLIAQDVKSKNELIFNWIGLFDTNMIVILTIMIIVAVINMVSSILILILERTQMIGILKSVGSSNWQIRKIFLYNGAYLVIKGLIWGNSIGLTICLIQYYTKFITQDES